MHMALRLAYLLNLGYLSGLDQAKEEYKRITGVLKDQWFYDLYLILFQPGDKVNLSITLSTKTDSLKSASWLKNWQDQKSNNLNDWYSET